MDAIIMFFQNQQWAMIAAMIFPIIFKYFPATKNITNQANTFLAVLSAWLVNVLGPAPAHASVFGDLFGPSLQVLNAILVGLSTKVIHEFITSPLEKALQKR